MIDKKSVKSLFDERARSLSGINAVLSSRDDSETTHQNIYRDYVTKKYVLKYLRPKRKEVILDFGCGIGRLSQEVAKKSKFVIGIDNSEKMLEIANKEKKSKNINYFFSESAKIPATSQFVSKIFTCWVFQHMDDQLLSSLLLEFYEILPSGGKIVAFEQTKGNKDNESPVLSQRSVYDYLDTFKRAGFKATKIRNVYRMPSYGMYLWKKHKLPKFFLPMIGMVEPFTITRKSEFVEYYDTVFVFVKP